MGLVGYHTQQTWLSLYYVMSPRRSNQMFHLTWPMNTIKHTNMLSSKLESAHTVCKDKRNNKDRRHFSGTCEEREENEQAWLYWQALSCLVFLYSSRERVRSHIHDVVNAQCRSQHHAPKTCPLNCESDFSVTGELRFSPVRLRWGLR